MPTVVPGLSSEADSAGTADDSGERHSRHSHRVVDWEEKRAPRYRLQDLPEWMEEFTMDLVDTKSTSSASDRADPPEPLRPDPLPSNRSSWEAQLLYTLSLGSTLRDLPADRDYKSSVQTPY